MNTAILDGLTEKCLSNLSPSLQTTSDFRDDLRQIRICVLSQLKNLDTDALSSMYFAHFAMTGYHVGIRTETAELSSAELELRTAGSVLVGLGLFPHTASGQSTIEGFLSAAGRFSFFRIWLPPGGKRVGVTTASDVQWVGYDDLLRVISALVVVEYFQRYFYTLQFAPSLIENRNRILKEELALSMSEMTAIEQNWKAVAAASP